MTTGVDRPPLTAKQAEVLAFIRGHVRDRGYPPTVREMCRQFGLSSPNAIVNHVRALVAKGYLEHTGNVSRGLRVVAAPETQTEKVARLRRELKALKAELAATIAGGGE